MNLLLSKLSAASYLSFSARYPAVHLGLRLGRGLRPMEKAKYESAFEQAQRCFILVFFRTAHCLREKKGPPKADRIYSDNQIPLLFDYSLRLAPSIAGVAVTS